MDLGQALRGVISRFLGAPVADKQAIEEMIRGIQRALLISDVKVELVKRLSDVVRKRSEEVKPPPGVSRKDQIVEIVYEELSSLLGGGARRFSINKTPYIVMMVGIQGTGKTTTVAKLANYLSKSGHRVGVVCADTYRPAAYQQLQQLLAGKDIALYGEPGGGDPVSTARRGVEALRAQGVEAILIDTAGRHRDQASLMKEMEELQRAIRPDDVALIIDATIGQQAGAQAEAFHRVAPVGWIILTKMDTSARGGGALSAIAATGAPIYFIGTGERLEEFEPFDPPRFVSRLLGIPDIEGIVERVRLAEVQVSRDEARAILSGRFTIQDMVRQVKEMRKAGPLDKLLKMVPIPGVQSLPEEQLEKIEAQAKHWEAIVNSMTKEEREDPGLIDSSRSRRIARGAGVAEREVKQLIKQYYEARRMMKSLRRARHKLPREVFQRRE